MIKVFPTLFGLTKGDTKKEWSIRVENDNGIGKIIINTGLHNGKKQEFITEVKKGKNIGKSNETTAVEQALAEAESKWKKKKQEGYSEGEPSRPIYPMLAHDYKKHGHKIKPPAYIQPKLNGVRCLAFHKDGRVKFLSRNGKEYETLSHIEIEIKKIFPPNTILDGEIYHHELGFQEIIRRVKRVKTSREDLDIDLQYWIYDIIIDNTFANRWSYLKFNFNKLSKKPSSLILTPTFTYNNKDELNKFHQKFIQDNYEGTIIRAAAGKYQIKHRSYDLLKYKDFIDEDFKIIGAKEAMGKDAGTIIFIVKNNINDEEFTVRPRGTVEQRTEWWNKKDELIGKVLTVRFQERSEDNKPIFPVGLCIRDYE